MRQLMIATLAALFVAGCGSKQTPETAQVAPEPQPPEPKAEVTLDVPLSFQTADGSEVAVPMIEGSVRDGSARFVLDSATPRHALTDAFAGQVRAPVKADRELGAEHGGVTVEGTPIEGVVAWTIGESELRFEDVIAVRGPEPYETYGIGGMLAPQRLASGRAVVVDMDAKKLRVVDGPDDEVTAWISSEYPDLVDLDAFYDDLGKPYAKMSVGENEAVYALIDTGGEITEFEAAYLAVDEDEETECDEGLAVEGECVDGVEVEEQVVRFAGAEFSPSTVTARRAVNDVEGSEVSGVVGADLLKGCTLLFWQAKSRIAAKCP